MLVWGSVHPPSIPKEPYAHSTSPFLNHILNPKPQLYTPYISLGSLQVRVAQAINRTAEPLTLMVGTDWGNISAILGLYGDNGKENGNYYDGLW